MKTESIKKILKTTTCLTMGVVVLSMASACSVETEPSSDWERAVRVDRDIQEMFGDQRVNIISRPFTIYEAMARALKYNLNARLKTMETVLAAKNIDISTTNQLPGLLAKAGYDSKQEYEAIVSNSLKNSYKKQNDIDESSVHVSWNALDFGVSYYQAKQNANNVLIVNESRRKQLQIILQDVRRAFWRAVTAERLIPEIDNLFEETTFVLEELRAVKENNPSNTVLSFELSLMETMHDLSEMKTELIKAHEKLASLMNLKPGTKFRLVASEEGNFVLPEIRSSLDRLEWLALMHRPELRVQDYQLKNIQLSAKKNLSRLFPNFRFFMSEVHDSDLMFEDVSLLQKFSSQIGLNLLNPLKMQKIVSTKEIAEDVQNLNRQVLSMSILLQTHLGWADYQGAKETYQLSAEIAKVAEELAQNTSENTKSEDVVAKAMVVSDAARALFAKLRMMMDFAKLQDATGKVFATLGLDPLPQDFLNDDVKTITKKLETVVASWDLGRFTIEDLPKIPPVPLHRPSIYLSISVPVKTIVEDMRFVSTIPPNAFQEADLGNDIVYSAMLFDGRPLPSWMLFDDKTITLSGRPPAQAEGVYDVKIVARNRKKLSAHILVTIKVVRGYRTIMDMRGAEPDSKVTVIQKCIEDETCQNNINVREIKVFPEKVKVAPLIKKQ
ncbi:MAG: TolC family protein [Alphaproteobacteria bacterium]|nr:TolC family protein [Alphaproteobacteria bacterium]